MSEYDIAYQTLVTTVMNLKVNIDILETNLKYFNQQAIAQSRQEQLLTEIVRLLQERSE